MKRSRTLMLLVITLLVVPTLQAEKKGKKKKGATRTVQSQVLKSLADVGLTEEQTSKVKNMGKEVNAAMKKVRDEAGITPELMKKRAEALKSLKDSDKKGKARQAAINEAAGFTKEQSSAIGKVNELRTKFQKDVIALLTAEQKEKLPARLKRLSKAKNKKNKSA